LKIEIALVRTARRATIEDHNLKWLLTEMAARRHSLGSTDSIVKPNSSEFPDSSGRGSMSTHYGSGDSWPRHQKPWWNEALAEAQVAGWTLDYVDAPHTFGIVFCPSMDDGVRHSFMVDKTARGGETKSKEARKLVRRCQHASTVGGSKVRLRQQECERLLHEAERLISIADAGLALAEAQTAAWVELERLETQLETAAANLVEILHEEQAEAWQAAGDADEALEPDAIAATLDDAASVVTETEWIATALRVRKPKLAEPLLGRAQAARVRISDLRDRLEALY
jgi:hypothetical protein